MSKYNMYYIVILFCVNFFLFLNQLLFLVELYIYFQVTSRGKNDIINLFRKGGVLHGAE